MPISEEQIKADVETLKSRGESSERIIQYVKAARATSDRQPEAPVASFQTSAGGEKSRRDIVTTNLVKDVANLGVEFGREAIRQYVAPGVKSFLGRGQLGLPTQEGVEASKELSKNLEPSLRMSPMLLNALPQYRASNLATQAAISGLSFAGVEGLTGASPREQAAAGIVGAAGAYNPGFRAGQTGLSRGAQYVGSSLLGGAVQGGAEMAAGLVRGEGLDESVSSASIPALVGATFGLAGQLGKAFEAYANEADRAAAAFGGDVPLAIRSPTMFGQQAAKAEVLGTDIGVSEIERRVGDEWIKQFGQPVDGAEIIAKLQPFTGKLDETTERLASLSRESLAANENLELARAALRESRANAIDATSVQQQKLNERLRDAANAAALQQAKDISNNAYKLQQMRLSGNYVAPADARNAFVERVMNPLDDHVKQTANVLQEAINVPMDAAFVSGKDIKNAIQMNMGSLRQEDLDAIMSPYLMQPKVNPKTGKPIKGGKEYRNLSRHDVQYIRNKLWNMQDSDLPNVPQLDSVILKKMDTAIAAATEDAIEAFSPGSLEPLRAFNAYWSKQAQAKANRHSRAFFVKDPNDEIITNLTNDIIKDGAASSGYTGIISYIDAAAAGNPVLQQEMKSHVFGLIRDSLMQRNYNSNTPGMGLMVDISALATDINRLEKGGFPVNQLGLDSKMINETARLANGAGLGSRITGQEFAAIMQNPAVKQAISEGKRPEPIIKKVVNEFGAARAYRESRWNEIAGRSQSARRSAELAEKRAREAGLSLADIERQVGDMSKDPLFVAFSGKKNFGINGEGHSDFQRFLAYINDPNMTKSADVSALLSAIEKKSPEMREQIALHTMNRTVEFLSKNQLTGERGIDWNAVGKFIDPSNPVSGEMAKNRLRTIVGDNAYSKLMESMPRIEIMRSLNRQREAVAQGRRSISELGTAGRGLSQGASGQGFGTTARSIGDWIGLGEYYMASLAMVIPGADKALRSGASMSEIIQGLGPQRAFIIQMNMPAPEEAR